MSVGPIVAVLWSEQLGAPTSTHALADGRVFGVWSRADGTTAVAVMPEDRYEPITYDPSDGSAKGVRG